MNILEMLSKELENKDWTLEEKARYLYIRCCELFVYDPRYKFCNKIPQGETLKNEILNKKIDLENVESNWTVCTSHIKEIYIKLLKILLNIDAEPTKLNKNSIHVWAEFHDGTHWMKADSAIKKCSDLTRVKMKLETQEYHPKKNPPDYKEHLKEIDKKIGYIKEDYKNTEIENLKTILTILSARRYKRKEDILLYKWQKIIEELSKYEKNNQSINLHTTLEYLVLHLLSFEEKKYCHKTELFEPKEEWRFLNIYTLEIGSDTFYYGLERIQNDFKFQEMKKEDVLDCVKNMEGIDKHHIYQRIFKP